MIYAINYADNSFKKAQNLNLKTAYKKGKADKVISYSPNDIDKEFMKNNIKILSKSRGGGYWLWKPYFIKKTLEKIEWNDYLFYCDSGAYYCNSIKFLVDKLEEKNEYIMAFEIPLIEKQWTKRDCFILLDCDEKKYWDTNQRIATYMLIKKTKKSMEFIDEYLRYSRCEQIITDKESILGDEFKEFIDHRHDQSIFSLLTKKYGIEAYREPSQYGDRPWEYFHSNRLYNEKKYDNSEYPRILISYRKANYIKFSIKEKIKDILQILNLRFI